MAVAAVATVAAAAAADTEAVETAPPTQKENPQPWEEDARLRVRYGARLPTLYQQNGENLCSILAGTVLLTLHGAVICKNWHLCGSFWEVCEQKHSPVPIPPEVTTTVVGLLKESRGE